MSLAKLCDEIEARIAKPNVAVIERWDKATGAHDVYSPDIEQMQIDLTHLLAIVRLQDEALKFYARRESWHIAYGEMISPYSYIKCITTTDLEQLSSTDGTVRNQIGGKTAREARSAADKLAAGGA